MLPGKEKGNDLAVAWHGLQRTLNHPNSGNHRLPALASVTGLEVLVMRIPYRSGSRPTGPQWCYNSCSRRRITIVQKTRLGWTRRRLLRTFSSNGNYRDGSWESNIRMLTGTIKVDWIRLPVEPYLAALPTLQQGVIAGVFRQKGAAPWGITRAEKLQLSVLLPNDLSLEDWYAGVYGLPTVWPEASMLGADNLRKVAGYDFHLLRKKYDVRTMWGDLDPQWRLLQSQLETRGPGWYSPAELKERLFTNKSKRPGDDTKEALRTDGNAIAWQAWDTARNIIWQSCQPGPPLVFPGEKEIFRAMYAQVGEEEQVISPPYTRTPLDASMRGRRKRKQGEDNALVGSSTQHGPHAACTGVWVAPSLVTPSYDLLYLKRAALLCLTSFTHGSGSTWIESGQHFCFIWMMYARARQTGTQGCSIFIDPGRDFKVSYPCLGDTFYARPGNCGPQGIELLEVWHSTSCWRCCESRGFWAMHQVVRAHTCFTCLTFIDWSAFVGLGLVVGAVLFVLLLLSLRPLTNLCDRVVNRWPV